MKIYMPRVSFTFENKRDWFLCALIVFTILLCMCAFLGIFADDRVMRLIIIVLFSTLAVVLPVTSYCKFEWKERRNML